MRTEYRTVTSTETGIDWDTPIDDHTGMFTRKENRERVQVGATIKIVFDEYMPYPYSVEVQNPGSEEWIRIK